MKKTKFQTMAKRRYFLHRAVKKHFLIVAKDRTVFVKGGNEARLSPHLMELLNEFGYNIQLVIE
jgi:type IV secretory pathway TrbD component